MGVEAIKTALCFTFPYFGSLWKNDKPQRRLVVSSYRRQTNENNHAEPRELGLFSGQKCTAQTERPLAGAATHEEQLGLNVMKMDSN